MTGERKMKRNKKRNNCLNYFISLFRSFSDNNCYHYYRNCDYVMKI